MKKSLFLGLIASVVMLASCGKLQKPEQITVTPATLELKGGKVAADITGTFPVKKFAKKRCAHRYSGAEIQRPGSTGSTGYLRRRESKRER